MCLKTLLNQGHSVEYKSEYCEPEPVDVNENCSVYFNGILGWIYWAQLFFILSLWLDVGRVPPSWRRQRVHSASGRYDGVNWVEV